MSEPKQHPRIPFEVDGIQVNHCKTPTCPNFGVPAAQAPEGKVNASQDPYRVIGGRRSLRQLTCHFCQRSSALRSNLAIAQEATRLDPIRWRAATMPSPSNIVLRPRTSGASSVTPSRR